MALSVAAPLKEQPPGVTRRAVLRCPDFPPALPVNRNGQRSSDPPAIMKYNARQDIKDEIGFKWSAIAEVRGKWCATKMKLMLGDQNHVAVILTPLRPRAPVNVQ